MSRYENNSGNSAPSEEQLNELTRQEQLLRVRALQQATMGFIEAKELDLASPGKYIRLFVTEFDEPTVAYRRDSIYPFMREDRGIEPEHFYVHLPADHELQEFTDRFWVRQISPQKVSPLTDYAVDSKLGLRVRKDGPGLHLDTSEVPEVDHDDISVEAMLGQSIDEKEFTIGVLNNLIGHLRDDTRLVPFSDSAAA